MGGSFIFGAQAKKRTAALWARSAMKGDDCGVYYSGRAFLSLYKPWPLLFISLCWLLFKNLSFAKGYLILGDVKDRKFRSLFNREICIASPAHLLPSPAARH